ncbi:MAG: type IX secretion system membrane protein PorP/SprF [Bacteroidia bacterium]|nr:type IX secretion system membrane protein PorP/SprF [Bacteroidia bacterium]
MKKLSFLCVTVFFFSNAFSQDEKFTSINQSLLEINPSFAGSNGGIRDQFIYSDQQRRSNKTSFYNGLDGYLKSLRGGLAITLSDQNVMSGMLRSTSTNLIYAPRLKCSKSDLIIVPSIQISYLKRSF